MNDIARLKVLLIEDDPEDALLIQRSLSEAGFKPAIERVETAESMREALEHGSWDVVLADYRVPGFGALGALAALKDTGLDIPFLVISGVMPEEAAAGFLRAGADDCLSKADLARLADAIRDAVQSARERREWTRTVRRKEERLWLALEAAGMGAWEWDLVSGAVMWSENYHQLLGLPQGPAAETFEGFLQAVHPDDRSRIRDELERSCREHVGYEIDFRVLAEDGSTRSFEMRGRCFYDEGNRPSRHVGVILDTTRLLHHAARIFG